MSDRVQNVTHVDWAEYFYDLAVRRDENVPGSVSSHVRRCGSCRAQVARLRRAAFGTQDRADRRKSSAGAIDVLDSHFQLLGVPVTCSQAKPFLPGLAATSVDLRIPTPVTVHIDHCPQCAADLRSLRELALTGEQSLSVGRLYEQIRPGKGVFRRRRAERDDALPQAVYAIAERPDSDVVTVCRTIDEGEKVVATPGDPYADYPIKVEIARREPQSARSRSRTVFRPLVRSFLKPAAAVAAVLALAALFLCTQSSSGVALGDVVRAFERVRNVRVIGFNPVTEEVMYELWVSRDLNLMGMVTGQECVVYDLAAKEREDLVTGRVSRIDDAATGKARTLADSCLGFSLASVPSNARWMRSMANGKREVYELMWTRQTYGGRDVLVKHEFVVDPATRLPVSLRRFYWDALAKEWDCASMLMLDYTTGAEMGSVRGGRPAGRAD
jgi:hypothetical protein